jgi:hypothetical protein
VAVGAIVAAGPAIDLVVLAVWLDIDDDAYAKAAAMAFVRSLFGLAVLGLTLAVPEPRRLPRALYTGALRSAVVGGLIATWLVVTAEDDNTAGAGDSGTFFIGSLPIGDDALLQVLGVMLVLLAASWFGALTASRLPSQTLKRTLTTSPSSTT